MQVCGMVHRSGCFRSMRTRDCSETAGSSCLAELDLFHDGAAYLDFDCPLDNGECAHIFKSGSSRIVEA